MDLTTRVFPRLPRDRFVRKCAGVTGGNICSLVEISGHGFRAIQLATAVGRLREKGRAWLVYVDQLLAGERFAAGGFVVESDRGMAREALDWIETQMGICRSVAKGIVDTEVGATINGLIGELAGQVEAARPLLDHMFDKTYKDVAVETSSLRDCRGAMDSVCRRLVDFQLARLSEADEARKKRLFGGLRGRPGSVAFDKVFRKQLAVVAKASGLWSEAEVTI